jgi:hypothetical protein
LSDAKYVTFAGTVQTFGADKPPVVAQDINGQTVYKVNIRTANQGIIGLTLWPEYAAVAPQIPAGAFISGDGKYTQSSGQNGVVYHNVSVVNLVVVPSVAKVEREVVNPAPTAAAPAAAPTAASPFGGF